jgi:hypothetical protein
MTTPEQNRRRARIPADQRPKARPKDDPGYGNP